MARPRIFDAPVKQWHPEQAAWTEVCCETLIAHLSARFPSRL